MNRSLPALAALGLLLGSASAAHAGYISAGIGAEADLGGTLDEHFSTENTSSGRIAIGERFGAVALEASLFGTSLNGQSQLAGSGEYSTVSMGIDLKYHIPISGSFEAFVKAGLNKTWLASAADTMSEYSGRGKELGAGVQYRLKLPITQAAIWLDYTLQDTELRSDNDRPLDGSVEMWTLGVSLGF